MEEEENVEKQAKKQAVNKYDFIKNYSWVKGQSGNPAGRPKGKTLKEFAREYLQSLPDDKKVEYLHTLPAEIVWKMAEGNPDNKSDITTDGEKLPTGVIILPTKNNDIESTE